MYYVGDFQTTLILWILVYEVDIDQSCNKMQITVALFYYEWYKPENP